MSGINFIHIEHVILELSGMFYFSNIFDISDSRDEICIICIPFDRKFDFKFSQINVFEILWNRLRKILKITI